MFDSVIFSQTIPYVFRENDDGESRRILWKEFTKKGGLPEELMCKEVDLEERYWENDRYVNEQASLLSNISCWLTHASNIVCSKGAWLCSPPPWCPKTALQSEQLFASVMASWTTLPY